FFSALRLYNLFYCTFHIIFSLHKDIFENVNSNYYLTFTIIICLFAKTFFCILCVVPTAHELQLCVTLKQNIIMKKIYLLHTLALFFLLAGYSFSYAQLSGAYTIGGIGASYPDVQSA